MRVGLRLRISIAFALSALVLSALLAVVTIGLVRERLVNERESSVTEQAYRNARVLRDALRAPVQSEQDLLLGLTTPAGASPVLFRDGQWFAANPVNLGREQLPRSLRDTVTRGDPARMRFRLNGQAHLAVGIPIEAVNASYFEIASFEDTEQALSSLELAISVAAVVTTAAGALLGTVVSRRVLRPLQHVSAAAQAIAGGRLDTRVARIADPDLGTLVNSFNDMAGALQERIERDARFASDVSHELRSPLTTLTTSVGILEARRDELPERSQAALDLLVADVSRFRGMVEDLLEISRFDAGAARLHLEPVRISELAIQAVSISTAEDVPVTIAAEAAARTVSVDKRRLVRVIANLVGNAERHAGGATQVSVELAGPDLRICVEDEGPGVPAEDRERIFERFARGAGAARRSLPGAGLGLAIVAETAARHGGAAWVVDGPDGGARFCLSLPGERS
jgi:two-component system sensor histidine kinase MtrB